ncbi:Glutathione S-transferase family protein [Oceaniovalibus guishaninsula JLT2003]|uniref:Glutathione S-transferase family protein n=1 Tax=Oceaniovalibus guishaninsula JLT2003 TaxID=1231392 RepID=K2GMA6_9RHOB|nr:hypothetical protein [Oceaniovalibus guishaninsula]EKE43866.1 Glutathione S-transferase family protein [Oceaniovalibus guishaninsula JLT2003]
MHSGFAALRGDYPMNLRQAYRDTGPSDAVLRELGRLDTIWSQARKTCGAEGPWLCGDYCVADAFFAPVAARIAGYGLPVTPQAAAYVAVHLPHPSFDAWRAAALIQGPDLPQYGRDHPPANWPVVNHS